MDSARGRWVIWREDGTRRPTGTGRCVPGYMHSAACVATRSTTVGESTYLSPSFLLLPLGLLLLRVALVVALALVACVALGFRHGRGRTLAGGFGKVGDVDLVVFGTAELDL